MGADLAPRLGERGRAGCDVRQRVSDGARSRLTSVATDLTVDSPSPPLRVVDGFIWNPLSFRFPD